MPIRVAHRDVRVGDHRRLERTVPPRHKPSTPAFLEYVRRAPQRRRLDRVRPTRVLRLLDRCTDEKTFDFPPCRQCSHEQPLLLHGCTGRKEKSDFGSAPPARSSCFVDAAV